MTLCRAGAWIHFLFLATAVFAVPTTERAAPSSPSDGSEHAQHADASDGPEELPYGLRAQLEEALTDKVRELLEETNESGASYKRGSFSRSFHKVGDDAYQVTFHQDTAHEDHLKTERLLLTLRPGPAGGAWEIVEEPLLDTYEGLVRAVPGDERFYRFDSLSLEREGLTVKASEGSLWVDYLDGRPQTLVLRSDRLSHGYTPPRGVRSQSRQIYAFLQEEEPEKLDFRPEHVRISCSPRVCEEILAASFSGLHSVSIDELDDELRKHYEDFRSEQGKRRRDSGFSGFRQPYDPERRFCSISLKKQGANHRMWLIRDSWAGWEVRVGVTGFGNLLGYYSEETLASGASPHDLERRDDRGARDFDLRGIRGTVELALQDSSTMTGDVTFTLVTKRALRELPFSISRLGRAGGSQKQIIDPSLVINSVQDQSGQELTWVKVGTSGGIVVLPQEVPAGSELDLRLQFENRSAIYKISQSYSELSRSGWLPFVHSGDMIHEFDLTVKVPARYKTLGIGEKIAESVKGNVSITRWVANNPVSFPTIIFGDYVVRRPGFEAKRSDGSVIPVTIHVDRDGMTDFGIRPKQLLPLADRAANSLNLYREVFGVDYPFAKLDLVNDPGFLRAQSPASIVYLGWVNFRGEGVVGTFLGSGATKFTRSLVAHEVGHQWWGGLVCHANERNYWFVESLAEYASALFVEAVNGRKDAERGWQAYLDHVADWRTEILGTTHIASVQDASSLNSGGYHAALYAKGPYAFHMLRLTFGDEKFYGFLKMLAQDLGGKEIVTRDIQQVAEKAFGGNMEWFFDQWIRGVGIPVYRFSYDVGETEDGNYLIEGVVRQRVVVGMRPLAGVYYRGAVPMTVTGRKSGKEYTVRLLVEGPETPFRFKVPEEPGEVVLNKYGEILAHDVLVDRGR